MIQIPAVSAMPSPTLAPFAPAYLSVSSNHDVPPLVGVRVTILFANELSLSNLPYSKRFMQPKTAWHTGLTLLGPAYLSVSKERGAYLSSLCILGLVWVRVPILFGNDMLWNVSPCSKGFMKFGCPEPSKVMFDF